jgi:transcriptional regulator with XRE-family HTH domain
MKITLKSCEDLGPLVRATRKSQGMRQDDTAEGIGVSENFLAKVERGGGTVQWQKLFQVLTELGIRVEIDVPDAAASLLQSPVKKRGAAR